MDNKISWEFLSLLQKYYEKLEEEKEFKRVNESSIMPNYNEFKEIDLQKILPDNLIYFIEFLKIYEVFWEVEKFEDFSLQNARKVLKLLGEDIFMEGHSPKFETHSLIEKFKINIAYQLSKSTSIDEINKWLRIAEEIRKKWKDIDMDALMKSGCSFFMTHNQNHDIKDPKLLILLNKFVGDQNEYKEKLWTNALMWLWNHYKEIENNCKAKVLLDALKSNKFQYSQSDNRKMRKIQNKLKHWTFDSYKKTKLYKRRIKNWITKGKKIRNTKIILQSEISNKIKFQTPESDKSKITLYECNYANKKAFIKEYKICEGKSDKNKSIFNEIANSIYLSEHNETGIFMNFFGLLLEKTVQDGIAYNNLGIVMEWCDSSLSAYINEVAEKKIEIGIDMNYFVDSLLQGFSLQHSLGMAHNDIKPQNILVVKKAGKIAPKIADYDISSTITTSAAVFSIIPQSHIKDIKATWNFAAPEIRKFLDDKIAKARINRMRADVFSLGLVFLYLDTFELPPDGLMDRRDYIKEGMKNVKNQWLKKLLAKMVRNNPQKRLKIGELIKLKKSIMQQYNN